MAVDNTVLSAGTADGDTIRDLNRAGVKTQIVALDLNPAGGETLMAGTMPVSAASLPLPSGASTSAKQDTGNTSIASVDTKVGEVQASPTANTVLDRLKTIAANILTTLAINLTQLAGTAIDVNSGVKSAGTQRVVLATDQPALTNKLLVTPDLPSGASTAAKQPALGTAGTASADVISVQGVASMTALQSDVTDRALRDNGKVDIASFDVALPAGTNLLGTISSSPETSTVYNGTTALTPKFAKIAASSSGNNNLVAAVTSKKLRVLGYNFISNGTVNAKFQGDGAGTPADLTGLKYCVANMGLAAPFNPVGWFETAAGKTLDINLSAAIAIGGELVYVEV